MAANSFEARVSEITGDGLHGIDVGAIQVNVGLRCNQQCAHCHLGAGPLRAEMMDSSTMESVARAAVGARCSLVDITGGSPELHPNMKWFIASLRDRRVPVQVRTNLTAMEEPGIESFPEFFRDRQVALVASMPCYLEENVRAQRGPGVYEKSVRMIRRLNGMGYGVEPGLPLNLVYNPGGPVLPPEQAALEAAYRRELGRRFGISFTKLLTITNMPLGRFREALRKRGEEAQYMRLLKDAFNPATVAGLMCRHQVSIGWDGTIYDCDFNLALKLCVDHGAPRDVRDFDASALAARRIVTGDHCFGCTAGSGSSCSGALV